MRILLAVGCIALVCGAPAVVSASPTWDLSLEELQAIGLGQSRGDPIPVPLHYERNRMPDEPPVAAYQGVIFVNFDGASLSSGSDDSKNNRTQIGNLAGTFAPYGDGSKRDAVIQAVQQDWAEYNVIITDTRPAQGDYVMNMTGPTNPYGGGVLGIAPLDCNDSQTHNNITYAFHSASDNFSASTTATTIGQEVAHSFGLEHVNDASDIMNPSNAGGDPWFHDECIQIVQSVVCGSQHAANCGSSTSQNAHQELLNLFGPGVPDTASPVVQITAPADGAEFDIGADFDIVATASDDASGLDVLVLFSNGEQMQTDVDEPYGWGVTNIPEGVYEFYVEASDLAGNSATSNIVTVYVGMDAPPDGGGDDAGDDGGSGGASDGGGDGGGDGADGGDDGGGDGAFADSGNLPPGFGMDDGANSCACRGGVGSGAAPTALMLGLLALAIRRRKDV